MSYFAGSLIYVDPNERVWQITRRQAENGGRYWHADLVGGNDHSVSVSCQRLLQNLDHPEMQGKNDGEIKG